MILTLPIPPSINAAYANVPFIGRVKTKAYRHWLKQADGHYLMQKRRLIPVKGRCIVTVRLPEAMKGDVSNRIKIAEDFLVSRKLTDDDAKNVRVAAERSKRVPAGFCEIEVRPV